MANFFASSKEKQEIYMMNWRPHKAQWPIYIGILALGNTLQTVTLHNFEKPKFLGICWIVTNCGGSAGEHFSEILSEVVSGGYRLEESPRIFYYKI